MDIKEKIYFDNAATTPMLEEVMYEMIPYMRIAYGNPSSTHSFGRETKAAIELARKKIAGYLNCKSSEIIFTSGGTEANNLAIYSAVHSLKVEAIITAKTEHKAVLNAVKSYQEILPVLYVDVDKKGVVDLKHLEFLLQSHPNAFVTLMHGNNEIGSILPLEEINELVGKYKAYFHSDAVQTIAHYNIDLNALKNIHFLSSSAHKFHGPKAIGFLFIRKGVKAVSQIKGGPQERELRAGTENVSAIVGMTKAMEMAYEDLEKRKSYILSLKSELETKLKEAFPELKINGSQGEDSLYTILNVSFPPFKSREMLPFALDLYGIAVSAGSACSSGSTAFSHVLRAIGSRDDWPAIRFSLSHLNTSEEIDRLIIALKDILK